MNLNKYKWKLRIILIETPDYNNEKYQVAKHKYKKNLEEFHKRYVKLVTKKDSDLKFKVKLIGFDGEVKKVYHSLDPEKVLRAIDAMPMGDVRRDINPINLSLFSDYNPDKTIEGLGYKDKEKALYTINRIKNEPIKYQVSVINTMIGRAKSHPHQTDGMRNAIKVFEKWMRDHKKNK